jgi:hypothetical protein
VANLFLPEGLWGREGSEHPDSHFVLVVLAAKRFGQTFLFTANLTYGKQHIRWFASRERCAVLA